MNFLVAIKNEKIFEELKKENNIHIISNNISYKEGILEILEKNKNIQCVIFDENLSGNIKVEKLIQMIKEINSTIKIIIILNKKNNLKEEYLLKNNILFFYEEEVSTEKIIEIIIPKECKIIAITGNRGSGKTIIILALTELLRKNKKILILEDSIKNNSIKSLFQKNKIINNQIIKIKNNLFLFNIQKIIKENKKEKNKIIFKTNQLKNNYDYIFIDIQNIKNYFFYQDLVHESILILNANMLEINKIKDFMIHHKNHFLVILNPYNENSISENILTTIFKNKIKIIGKINYNQNFNTILNHQINFSYLDKKTKNNLIQIIQKIK